jgi:S1-C subfamily serine protease
MALARWLLSRVWAAIMLPLLVTMPAAAGAATCQEPLSAIYAKTAPAVVSIQATKINKARPDRRFETIAGSGFLVEPDGLLLTNAHVVDGAASILATLHSGDRMSAEVVGLDPVLDVALVKLQVATPQPVVRLGDSSAVKVGDEVVTIGSPVGLELTMTRGIVSALNRVLPYVSADEPMLQTDAPINPGNSGGPLLDRCATVVGVNTLYSEDARNVAFAIPINAVKQSMRSLRDSGHVVRPWLGIQGRAMDPRLEDILKMPVTAGYLVEVVEDGSPAERAGLRGGHLSMSVQGEEYLLGGDIVTAVNGVPVRTQQDWTARVRALRPGTRAKLTIFRDGASREVTLPVAQRPRLPYDLLDE